MVESVFKDGYVTSTEANQVAKEIGELPQEVLDDIRASLLGVLENYYSRANLALVKGHNDVRYRYLQRIKEFEEVLALMGVLRQQDRDPIRFHLNSLPGEQVFDEPITDF